MLAGRLEEPGFSLLELVHVVVVVGEESTSGLHVAHASELQAEVDAVALGLGFHLGDLAAKLLGRFGGLRGLGHLAFELGDASVALGDLLLPVGNITVAGIAAYFLLGLRAFLLLLLLRLVLRTLRGFLVAIGLTVHAVSPFVIEGGQHEGSPPICDEVSGLSQLGMLIGRIEPSAKTKHNSSR